ncbi:rhamnan synthesis F family protein [Methylocystis heyeri]|uniref:Uncharacterized protein n=1 Tax=Methylocystis heyeri TaxID=391905 RepID=A0A6B8KBZ1_9HYPH|nr:rhamnan synthesis F family protein [Methylocystis heyeri]QGM45082.1 hypothetical protein H2LOC_004915 [Methylocystis heyeri]
MKENRDLLQLFDVSFYLEQYPDVASAGVDPVAHYLIHGATERRNPHPLFDTHFYLEQYPDIVASGVNPLVHYVRCGAKERRNPHPLFDTKFYLEQNPDVSAAGIDPLVHYLLYGAEEGRQPNPVFDTGFYREKNPDCASSNPLAHYVRWGAKHRRAPHPSFDSDYYAYSYPEVSSEGFAPLAHYLHYGINEGRRTNLHVVGDVASARLDCLKPLSIRSETALFVTHSPDGRMKPHILHHLSALKRHGVGLVLIVACDTAFRDADDYLLDLVDGMYIRQNVGFDFAAWAHLLRLDPELHAIDTLYLINDSIVGPLDLDAFGEVMRRIRDTDADVIGLTDNIERQWHLQSYFLAFNSGVLTSRAFADFFNRVESLSEKQDVINLYETRLAGRLSAAGLRCKALFPSRYERNATTCDWEELVESGFPFVKMEVLRSLPDRLHYPDWMSVAGNLLIPSQRTSNSD